MVYYIADEEKYGDKFLTFLTFRRRLPVRGSGSCRDLSIFLGRWPIPPWFSRRNGPPTEKNGKVSARPATPNRETAAKGEKGEKFISIFFLIRNVIHHLSSSPSLFTPHLTFVSKNMEINENIIMIMIVHLGEHDVEAMRITTEMKTYPIWCVRLETNMSGFRSG